MPHAINLVAKLGVTARIATIDSNSPCIISLPRSPVATLPMGQYEETNHLSSARCLPSGNTPFKLELVELCRFGQSMSRDLPHGSISILWVYQLALLEQLDNVNNNSLTVRWTDRLRH